MQQLLTLTCLIHLEVTLSCVFLSEILAGRKDCSWSLITSYPQSHDPSLSVSEEATGPTIFRIKTKGKVPSPGSACVPAPAQLWPISRSVKPLSKNTGGAGA